MQYVLTALVGAIISFIASIPVGAVNMAVVQATLNKGRKSAYMIGLGAIVIEALYCAIPLFSLSFDPEKNSNAVKIISLISIPLLIFLGIWTIIRRKKNAIAGVRQTKESKAGNEILYGAILCATNPMVLFFWAYIITTLSSIGILTDQIATQIPFLVGVPGGTFLLYYVFTSIAHRKKRNIGIRTRARINLIVGVIFILLGFILGANFLYKFYL